MKTTDQQTKDGVPSKHEGFLQRLKRLFDPGRLTKSPTDTSGQWLGVNGSEHLFTLHMHGVSNVLDADAIWDKRYGGQVGIMTEVEGKARATCLYDALQDHPRIVPAADKKDPSRLDYSPRTFTDVVVWIPERPWRNEASQGGHKFSVMVNRLAFAHRRDFKNQLNPERGPQYCIMPDPQLEADEVVCQFGLSVFIPAANDEQVAELVLRKGGQGYSLTPWIFYEQGRRVTRPFGLYPGQQYLQLGPDRQQSCTTPPIWFGHGKGVLQLSLAGESADEAGLLYQQRQQYADGQYVQEAREPETGFGGKVVCPYHAVGNRAERLDLEVKPLEPAAERLQSSGDDTDANAILAGLTIIGPAFQAKPSDGKFRLLLRGVGLPRWAAEMAPNLGGWELLFDCNGGLLTPDQARAGYGLRLSAQSGQANVLWQTPDMAAARTLQPPLELNCQGQLFRLTPSPIASEYYALLALPWPRALSLDSGLCILGRPDGSQLTNHGEQHLGLDLLDKPGTLLDTSGQAFGRSLNYLGLSARHVGLRVQNGMLHVQQMSASSPVYILDQDSALLGSLAAGEDREVVLPPDGQLLVGNYWLQFGGATDV